MTQSGGTEGEAPLLRSAKLSYALLILSLIWMKPVLAVGGLGMVPADVLFIVTAGLWAAALVTGQTKVSWHPGFWLLAIYFAAMGASVLVSPDPQRSAFKLLTQAYLLSLPVLTFNLVDSWADLKRAFGTWLVASAILAILGVATLLLFPLLGRNSILDGVLHHYGTLPPGPYPRLELTFEFPAMMANYLAASLMILLVSERLAWIGRRPALLLGAGILATAFFALTPGFGGLLLTAALWFSLLLRDQKPKLARASLLAGLLGVLGFTVAAAVTPIVHRTAPFLIEIPSLSLTLAPSVRMLAWIDAARSFLDHALLGHGIGLDAVHVPYESPEGAFGIVTDAHNSFLNVAAQCGLVGLAALIAVLLFAVRAASPFEQAYRDGGAVRLALVLAFVGGMAVQGLVGSFEDARHLWIVFGLLVAADRLDSGGPERT